MNLRRHPDPVQTHPGSRSVTALAIELGIPAGTLTIEVDRLNGWTVDARVTPSAVTALRQAYGARPQG